MNGCETMMESLFLEYPVAVAAPSAPCAQDSDTNTDTENSDEWIMAEIVDKSLVYKQASTWSKWSKLRDKWNQNEENINKICTCVRAVGKIVYTQPKAVAIGATIAGLVATTVLASPALISGGLILYTLPKMTLFHVGTVNYNSEAAPGIDVAMKETEK